MFQEFFTSEWLLTFDMQVYKFAEKLWGTVMDPIMIFFTHLGDDGIFWIALGVVLLFFKKTRKLGIAALASIALVGFMNNIVFKEFFGRLRPYVIDDAYWQNVATDGWRYTMPFEHLKSKSLSFPSGHTSSSIAAAFGIFYIDKKKGIIPLIIAALVSFSRIYIHVHYPSDVVAGVIIGVLFAYIACVIVFKAFGKTLDKLNEKFNYKLFPANEAPTQSAEAVEDSATEEVAAETEVEAEPTVEETPVEEVAEETTEEAEEATEEEALNEEENTQQSEDK